MEVSLLLWRPWMRAVMDVKTLSCALELSKICCAVRAMGKAVPSGPWICPRGGRALVSADRAGLRQIDRVGRGLIGIASEDVAPLDRGVGGGNQLLEYRAHFVRQILPGGRSRGVAGALCAVRRGLLDQCDGRFQGGLGGVHFRLHLAEVSVGLVDLVQLRIKLPDVGDLRRGI